jgi:hypothetical protein
MKASFKIILIIMVLAAVSLACGTSTTGEKVGESASATSAPAQVTTYKVGDIIKVDDYTITLNSAQVTGSKLVANFTFDNSSGSQERAVSSIISFTAKDTDGNKLDFAMCDSSSMDGKILVGDKLKGNVCWDGVKSGAKLKIYFDPTLIGSGAIVWEVAQ